VGRERQTEGDFTRSSAMRSRPLDACLPALKSPTPLRLPLPLTALETTHPLLSPLPAYKTPLSHPAFGLGVNG